MVGDRKVQAPNNVTELVKENPRSSQKARIRLGCSSSTWNGPQTWAHESNEWHNQGEQRQAIRSEHFRQRIARYCQTERERREPATYTCSRVHSPKSYALAAVKSLNNIANGDNMHP
jgi:hypothetical protein